MQCNILRSKSLSKLYKLTYFHIRKDSVSTWSPLGAAFNSLPNKKLNLKLSKSKGGLFGIEQLTSYDGFYLLQEGACNRCEELMKETLSPNRTRKMVDIFDDLSNTLCEVADLAEFIRVAHPDVEFRHAAENVTTSISGVVEKLNTNRELYEALKNSVINGDKFPTNEVDQHVSNLFLFDFEQSGIHLPENERDKVVKLNDNILNCGQAFMSNASKPKIVSKEIAPQPIRPYFSNYDNNSLVINSLYADTPNETAREFAYKVYLYPDPHQEFLLEQLLTSRHELAVTCGFPTYAHRAVKSTVADTPDFVNEFLKILNENLKPKAQNDLRHMKKLKNVLNSVSKIIQPWDVSYFTSMYKKNYLLVDVNEIGPYLCLGACMEGLNNLTSKLFGISLVYEDLEEEDSWAPDIYKLAVVHETEGLLGHIYCDFYQRPDKPNQDCHFTIRGGRELPDGSYQNPIVVLMLHLERPQWSSPCLLTPSQLDNLVHEMGHALHSMLARTKHQHVTGTRCCTDFAEVPSILMEYFISDPRVLKTFTKHFQTNDHLNHYEIDKLCKAKFSLNAFETQTQVMYSALDQRLHGKHPLGKSTTEIFNEIQEEYSVLRPVKNTAWQLRFSHLVGYGAKYYSYLLSRSIASTIWQTYFKNDPFSRDQGERYRHECLRHGGGKPPRLMISEYLNKEASPENMAESLIKEIDEYQKRSEDI